MLTWTSSLPSSPGWYWWRESDQFSEAVRRVTLLDGVLSVAWAYWDWEPVDIIGGEWAGPLPLPLEPPSKDHHEPQ